MKNKVSLRQRYLEALGSQAASLSLSNLPKFYSSYVTANKDKVESELNRVGYFVLKNKVSIGESSATTKDVFISTYFVNMDMIDECNRMLYQKYHGDSDIRTTNGFFVPSTNELVVIVRVNGNESVTRALNKADIRSTIEHELTHAFDHTNKDQRLANQKPVPGIGDNFLSACAYLGCASNSDIRDIIMGDFFTGGAISECIFAISIILYKLFTITEFNAHQVSDLDKTHKVDIRKSDDVRKALSKDIAADSKVTEKMLKKAVNVTPNENPYLWKIVGNVLNYLGYRVPDSPSAVYRFFKTTSERLFKKFTTKKLKNQVKAIVSLREKNSIKEKLINCIENDNLDRGISFWFSPSGISDSFLCRVRESNNKLSLSINNKDVKLYGNVDVMLNRAITSYSNNDMSKFEFAVDNLVDSIVQSIERNFNEVGYDPVYDITEPQDDIQISKSNKVNRFADLDWD